MKNTLAISAAFLLFLMGCSDSMEEPAPALPEPTDILTFGTKAPTDEAADAASTAAMAARSIMAESSSWSEADRAYREAIERAPVEHRGFYAEAAAHEMLPALLEEEATPDRQEAVAFYTRALVDAQSPNAPLVFHGLNEMADEWDEGEIEAAALKAAAAGEAYVLESCESCDGNVLAAANLVDQRVVAVHIRETARAVSALHALAD